MSGWNGSGGFTLPYDWTVDAANAIPISSTRMMGQEDTLVSGLLNCMTLDSQTKPVADIDFNTHKGINVVAGVNPTDAVNVSQLSGSFSLSNGFQIIPATISAVVVWVSLNTFKTTALDTRAFFTPGRKLRIVHNSGASVYICYVVSAIFGTDTVITVGGITQSTNLISTITQVTAGIETLVYSTTSADVNKNASTLPISGIRLYSTAVTNMVSGGLATLNLGLGGSFLSDPFGEITGGSWVPLQGGSYLSSYLLTFRRNGAVLGGTNTLNAYLYDSVNATQIGPNAPVSIDQLASTWDVYQYTEIGLLQNSFLNSNIKLRIDCTSGITFTGGPPTVQAIITLTPIG